MTTAELVNLIITKLNSVEFLNIETLRVENLHSGTIADLSRIEVLHDGNVYDCQCQSGDESNAVVVYQILRDHGPCMITPASMHIHATLNGCGVET